MIIHEQIKNKNEIYLFLLFLISLLACINITVSIGQTCQILLVKLRVKHFLLETNWNRSLSINCCGDNNSSGKDTLDTSDLHLFQSGKTWTVSESECDLTIERRHLFQYIYIRFYYPRLMESRIARREYFMMYTVWEQNNNDKINDNLLLLLLWKMRKIFIFFLEGGFFKLKKKKCIQHYENNAKYNVFVIGFLYSCIKYITWIKV